MPFLALCQEDRLPKDAKPLAIVRSSNEGLDNKLLGLYSGHESEPVRRAKAPAPKLEHYERALKKAVGQAQLGRAFAGLVAAVKANADEEDVPAPLRRIYASMCAESAGPKIASCIELPPGSSFQLVPNPDPKVRDVGYFAGPAGSGKSWAAAQWAEKYYKLWPDRKIFMFTANDIEADPAWAKLLKSGALTILDPKTLWLSPMDVARDFPEEGSLTIYDDCIDAFAGKQEKSVLLAVQNQLQLGRKFGQSVLVISHELSNYSKTRAILHDSHWCCVFPSLTPPHSLKYFLSKIGIDPKIIPQMRTWGRAVYLSLRAPQWAVSEHSARLLTDD